MSKKVAVIGYNHKMTIEEALKDKNILEASDSEKEKIVREFDEFLNQFPEPKTMKISEVKHETGPLFIHQSKYHK